MLRTVQRLIQAGRLRRYWREGNQYERDRVFDHAAGTLQTNGSRVAVYLLSNPGCWVYALDGRTEDGR